MVSKRTWLGISVFACLLASLGIRDITQASVNSNQAKSTERVLVVGSSVAEGWNDSSGGGYLNRAFRSFSNTGSTNYQVYNHSVAGETVLKVRDSYSKWIEQIHPQIVAISWGALDDLSAHTPLPTVKSEVEWEVELALAAHAVVFIITPPVTRASYTSSVLTEPAYLHEELAGARSVGGRNVYIFDVFNQMKSYLTQHKETYVPFMSDGWHPNTQGHALAGELLFEDLSKQFGSKTVAYG